MGVKSLFLTTSSVWFLYGFGCLAYTFDNQSSSIWSLAYLIELVPLVFLVCLISLASLVCLVYLVSH